MSDDRWPVSLIDYPVRLLMSDGFKEAVLHYPFAARTHTEFTIAGLPVEVDAYLPAGTAIVIYRSGKMVYLTPDGPRRTPEEEAAAMEKFMAAEPPPSLYDPGQWPCKDDGPIEYGSYGLMNRCWGRDESKEQPS